MAKTLGAIRRVDFQHEWTTGPRWFRAGVRLYFEPYGSLEIRSEAEWPADDFSEAVEQTIRETLRELHPATLGGRFVLEAAYARHRRSSTEWAFRTAAREAVRSIYSMSEVVEYSPPL